MSRYIAVAGIHGELGKLNSLLSKIKIRHDDIFIFLGDYIDRGPKSKEVVDRLIKLSKTNQCVFLIGASEYTMLNVKNDEYYKWIFENYGGMATIKATEAMKKLWKFTEIFTEILTYTVLRKITFLYTQELIRITH